MAINEWWARDPDERFWLEITDRTDLGGDLHAPKRDQSGRETWSYELLRFVRDGDLVFHWWNQPGQEPSIVGFSTAIGQLKSSSITWQAHGTYGQASGAASTRPSWKFGLVNYVELERPVTLDRLRKLEPSLRAARDELRRWEKGSLYFPYSFSDRRPLRTTQGYLVKMPTSVLFAIPELAFIALGDPFDTGRTTRDRVLPTTHRKGINQGRRLDPLDRRAIERHAMEWALDYLQGLGFEVEDVGHLGPYDIQCNLAEHSVRVEVKGSTGSLTTVELTEGEVRQSRQAGDSALIVVDEIELTKGVGDQRSTSGGRPRVWWSWQAEDSRLTSTHYRYVLPPQGGIAQS